STGTRLLYVTPRGGQVWDWSVGKKLCDFPFAPNHHFYLTPDGRHLYPVNPVIAGKVPPLRVLDASTGKEVHAYPQLRKVALPGNGYLDVDLKHPLRNAGPSMKVYDVNTGKVVKTLDVVLDRRGRVSRDGRRLLTASKLRDELRLVDVMTGR